MMAVNASDRYSDTNEVMADINALDTEAVPLVVGNIRPEPVAAPEQKKQERTVPKSENFENKKGK